MVTNASETQPQLSRLEILEDAIDRYGTDPSFTRSFLKRWSDFDREELAQLGVQILGRKPDALGATCLARALAADQRYYRYLLLPSVLTQDEATAAAACLSELDPDFSTGLLNETDEVCSSEAIVRTLHIINELNRANVSVFWLRRMTNHTDEYIRSRAVMTLCKLYKNPQLIERQLNSPEARVRANAVEALWGINNESSRTILSRAGADLHHRVAINALRGLYAIGAPGARERIAKMAEHDSPMFRAAAAWCMGDTRDPWFREALNKLLSDGAENVRAAATTALARLPAEASVESVVVPQVQGGQAVELSAEPHNSEAMAAPKFWLS